MLDRRSVRECVGAVLCEGLPRRARPFPLLVREADQRQWFGNCQMGIMATYHFHAHTSYFPLPYPSRWLETPSLVHRLSVTLQRKVPNRRSPWLLHRAPVGGQVPRRRSHAPHLRIASAWMQRHDGKARTWAFMYLASAMPPLPCPIERMQVSCAGAGRSRVKVQGSRLGLGGIEYHVRVLQLTHEGVFGRNRKTKEIGSGRCTPRTRGLVDV